MELMDFDLLIYSFVRLGSFLVCIFKPSTISVHDNEYEHF
jgi:hypothetical protein